MCYGLLACINKRQTPALSSLPPRHFIPTPPFKATLAVLFAFPPPFTSFPSCSSSLSTLASVPPTGSNNGNSQTHTFHPLDIYSLSKCFLKASPTSTLSFSSFHVNVLIYDRRLILHFSNCLPSFPETVYLFLHNYYSFLSSI